MEAAEPPDDIDSQWKSVVTDIVAALTDPTWHIDKGLVILRGMPGSGKTTFRDLLVGGLRKELQDQRYGEEAPRLIRICSTAITRLYTEDFAISPSGRTPESIRRTAQEDIRQAINEFNFVVIDDVNIGVAEWQPTVAIAQKAWKQLQYGICAVTIKCRDVEHAIRLNRRSWFPLPEGDVRQRYDEFVAASDEFCSLPMHCTIEPNI